MNIAPPVETTATKPKAHFIRSRLFLGLAGLCLLLWGIKAIHRATQPKYQGKTTAEWFAEAQFETHDHYFPGIETFETMPSALALKAMGTNGVALLWNEYRHGESRLWTGLRAEVRALFGNRSPIIYSNERAYYLLLWLGPEARQLVPQLLQQVDSAKGQDRREALELLASIHSEPELVIPKLIPIFQDENHATWFRFQAADTIAAYGQQAGICLPMFRQSFAYPKADAWFKRDAALSILRIAGQGQAEAEYLVNLAANRDTDWSSFFERYKEKLGPVAIQLVPHMVVFSGTLTNSADSNAVMKVVKELDPQGSHHKP
ncbi:MAG TPA: hypothetical protein VGH19_15920 [Verrucomicrobiae bacterium]